MSTEMSGIRTMTAQEYADQSNAYRATYSSLCTEVSKAGTSYTTIHNTVYTVLKRGEVVDPGETDLLASLKEQVEKCNRTYSEMVSNIPVYDALNDAERISNLKNSISNLQSSITTLEGTIERGPEAMRIQTRKGYCCIATLVAVMIVIIIVPILFTN